MAERARRALTRSGWRFEPENGVLWRLSRAASFEREGFFLDLHWGLHAGHLPAWSLGSLERRLWQGATAGRGGMLEPDAESLLVYLAVHAVGHGFERPEWGENVHRAAALVSDWDEVRQIARAARVEGAVRAALRGDPIPHEIVLDGLWGRTVSGVTWVARGHFIPRSVRDRIREAVALGREGFGYLSRSARVRSVGGLELSAPRGVFRAWALTEELADVALEEMREKPASLVIDVGTGSGGAALLIAKARPDVRVHGTDVSTRAVRAARRNAEAAGVPRVGFHVGDLLDRAPDSLHGTVDLIISNLPAEPPVVGVSGHDPRRTLLGERGDGMGLIRRLVAQGASFLRSGGRLVVLMRDWQTEILARELPSMGYRSFSVRPSSVSIYEYLVAIRR